MCVFMFVVPHKHEIKSVMLTNLVTSLARSLLVYALWTDGEIPSSPDEVKRISEHLPWHLKKTVTCFYPPFISIHVNRLTLGCICNNTNTKQMT